jgi:hypothetical protein
MPNNPVTERVDGNRIQSVNRPQSQLYNLVPKGVGTPYTESLTSYLTRLADAYNVSTGTVFTQALAPLLNKAYLTSGRIINVSWRACAINGSGVMAADWAELLELLTHRSDLRYLTLLTWKDLLSQQGLLRSTQAWCPLCFEEWRATGEVVYEPLLWTLQVLTICPSHRCKLQQRCPYVDCHHLLPWISRYNQLGYCGYCHRWLGISAANVHPEDEQVDAETLAQQKWAWENVGKLIALAPQVSSPPVRQNIERGVVYYFEQAAQEKVSALAQKLEVTGQTMWSWRVHHSMPRLVHLLRMCHQLGIPLHTFLMEEKDESTPNSGTFQSQSPWRASPKKERQPRSVLQKQLEAIMAADDEPPPSLAEVARRLGYRGSPGISRKFPDLCQVISTRFRTYQQEKSKQKITDLCEQVRRLACELHARGMYPATSRISKLGMKSGDFRHPVVRSAWLTVCHELGWK